MKPHIQFFKHGYVINPAKLSATTDLGMANGAAMRQLILEKHKASFFEAGGTITQCPNPEFLPNTKAR